MRPIRAVIIGCGAIGPIHAAAVAQSEAVELYGVCDLIEERAAVLAESYNCRVFTQLEQVLADQEVDSIHICTPHYLHAEMAIQAARAGKHIVLEKPIAMNVQQAREVAEAVQSAGVTCGAILQNRMNPSVHKAKRLISDGALGRMLGIKGFLTWNRTASYYSSEAWRGKWETEGGGVLINQAVHMLDLMYYLGGDIEAVKGNIDTRVLGEFIEVEDTAEATFYYKDGKNGIFYATNGHSEDSPFYMEMHMEKGLLRYQDDQLILKTTEGNELLVSDKRQSLGKSLGKSYWGSGHARVINDFYMHLQDSQHPFIGLHEAAYSMGLLDAIYASSKSRCKEVVHLY